MHGILETMSRLSHDEASENMRRERWKIRILACSVSIAKACEGGLMICLQVQSFVHRAFRKIALWDIDEPSRNVNGTAGSGI